MNHLARAIFYESAYQTYLAELRANGRKRMPSRRRFIIDYSTFYGWMPADIAAELARQEQDK